MDKRCIVGYCPALYDTLQILVYQELPYEPIDDYPLIERTSLVEQRTRLSRLLIDGLAGDPTCSREWMPYIDQLYDAIDDDVLKGLIEFDLVEELLMSDRGYYLAIKR